MRLLAVLLLLPWPALAQSSTGLAAASYGTDFVRFLPNATRGQLSGCTFEYQATFSDWTSKAGTFMEISGSFGVTKIDGYAAGYVKAAVHELWADHGTVARASIMPASVWLLTGSGESTLGSLRSSQAYDPPGSVLSGFILEGKFLDALADALDNRKVSVVFSTGAGRPDVAVELDLTVYRTDAEYGRSRSSREVNLFRDCVKRLSRSDKT